MTTLAGKLLERRVPQYLLLYIGFAWGLAEKVGIPANLLLTFVALFLMLAHVELDVAAVEDLITQSRLENFRNPALSARAELAGLKGEWAQAHDRQRLNHARSWKRRSSGLLVAAFAAAALPATAHHSAAIYDMDQNIHFDGVVETLKMSNPHMALTLKVTKDDGTIGTINFIEGAPANMLVRLGLDPADIAVGKPIKAIGAPLFDDPDAYFLKAIILPDGRRFTFVD